MKPNEDLGYILFGMFLGAVTFGGYLLGLILV